MMSEPNLILYKTADGQAHIALYARDGNVWLTQAQMAELFTTSKQNISSHIINVLEGFHCSEAGYYNCEELCLGGRRRFKGTQRA